MSGHCEDCGSNPCLCDLIAEDAARPVTFASLPPELKRRVVERLKKVDLLLQLMYGNRFPMERVARFASARGRLESYICGETPT